MDRINQIDNQIISLQERRERLLSRPMDKFEHGDVVWFTKRFSVASHVYTYAAVKIGNHWYITQNGARYNLLEAMLWDNLLDFIGDGEIWAATEWEKLQ